MKNRRAEGMFRLAVSILLAFSILTGAAERSTAVFASGIEEPDADNDRENTEAESAGSQSAELESEKTEKSDADANTNRIEVRELDLGDYCATMEPGTKQLLTVTPIPVNATDQEVTFQSQNESIATINGIGRITAIKEGKTKITVSCGGVSESFLLTVKAAEAEDTVTTDMTGTNVLGTDMTSGTVLDTTVAVKDIEFSDHEDKLAVGETMSLTATVLPADATEATVSFKSSDASIATVNSSGEVKGIKKGSVTIIATAGSVSRKVSLSVYVKTTGIDVSKEYLVLKPGDEAGLNAKAQPEEAAQELTYRSSDASVAKVDEKGMVTACGLGNAAILVTNGDMTISVSVIVGKEEEGTESASEVGTEKANEQRESYDEILLVSECPVITEEMLTYYYQDQSRVCIQGDGYSILLDGGEIVNTQNCLITDLQLTAEKDGISFVLNNSEYLPGPVTICLEDVEGKYLYLYNEAKNRYERIKADDLSAIKLTTAGKYLITDRKQRGTDWVIVVTVICGTVAVIAGMIAYIAIKKKYWFW